MASVNITGLAVSIYIGRKVSGQKPILMSAGELSKKASRIVMKSEKSGETR